MTDPQAAALVACFHVSTARGDLYGVAATTRRDALAFVAERIAREGGSDAPRVAQRVGTWEAAYGTVLCYGRDHG